MIIIKIINDRFSLKEYGGRNKMSFIASALANLGGLFANMGSQACVTWWWDEEETPKSLIK